jgi:hypothetical protein
MNQMAVNIDERRMSGRFMNNVGVPDFLIERFRCHWQSSRILTLLSPKNDSVDGAGGCGEATVRYESGSTGLIPMLRSICLMGIKTLKRWIEVTPSS